MSQTPLDNAATSNPDSPQSALTGTPATLYIQLLALTEEATAAELAVAAGLGRSTTSRALVNLEDKGLAIRIRGGHDGPRRVPDLWHAAPTESQVVASSTHTKGHGASPLEPTTADTAGAVSVTHGAAQPAALEADDGAPGSGTDPEMEERQDGPVQVETHRGSSDNAEGSDDGSEATPEEGALTVDSRKRLAPGGLRQMVVDHLQAHPGKAFTATGISRAIERSSGAIANALATLAKRGIAEQVDERPCTYRLKETAGKQ